MPKLSPIPYAAALTGLIFLGDELAGRYTLLGIYYVFPVMIVAWARGINIGVVWALGSMGLSFLETRLVGGPSLNVGHLSIQLLGQFLAMLVAAFLAAYARKVYTELRTVARIDFLTGALNRLAFNEALDRHIHLGERSNLPFALMNLDCDDFKDVNDRFGHQTGDRVLVLTAQILKKYTRRFDSVARLGADLFAVLLHDVDEASAQNVASSLQVRLREAIAAEQLDAHFSIGVAVFVEPPKSVTLALSAADDLMYRAKHESAGGKMLVRRIMPADQNDAEMPPRMNIRAAMEPHLL